MPILVVLLALSLRFWLLGAPSLWADEGYSLHDASTLSGHALYRPLYYLFLREWRTLDAGVAWLRAPSALASAASVALLLALARRLSGTRVAVLAAVLMTLSVSEQDHAQEIRMYAPGALLALGAVALLWLWHEHRRRSALAAHIVVAVAAISTTPAALLLIGPAVGYAAWLEWRDRRRGKWLAGAWAGVLAAAAPWVGPALGTALRPLLAAPHPASWPAFTELAFVPAKLLVAPIGSLAGSRAATALFRAFGVLCVVLPAMAAMGGEAGGRRRTARLLALWFAVPVAAAFALARTVLPIWEARYFVPLAPVLYVLLALGLDEVLRRWRLAGVATVALALAALALRMALYFVEPQREDWRGAVAFADAVTAPGDVVWLGGRHAASIWDVYHRSGLPACELWAGAGRPVVPAAVAPGEHRGRIVLLLRTTQDARQLLEVPGLLPRGSRMLGSFRSGWVTALLVLPGG